MSNSLRGQVALVTGGSRGVGKGIAEELAKAGAKVYVTGRSVNQTKFEGECLPIVCDHTDNEQVKAVFARIRSEKKKLQFHRVGTAAYIC